MKITLDKLVEKIKGCNFYRISFDPCDEKPVWIIGNKTSYIEKVAEDYSTAHLNVVQAITIGVERRDDGTELVSVFTSLDLDGQINEPCEKERDGHFYKFESPEDTDVVDFETFDAPDKFFEDILKNLNNILKDKYNKSIENLNPGHYYEIPFGKENNTVRGTDFGLVTYDDDMTGLGVQTLLMEPSCNYGGIIFFVKLNHIIEHYADSDVYYLVNNPKDKILELIKRAVVNISSKDLKNSKLIKWLEVKIKGDN